MTDAPTSDRAARDGSPAASDLQGSWYADLAASDGGSPLHERLRFSGSGYTLVTNGEVGAFSANATTVHFQPSRIEGYGPCSIGPDRVEELASDGSGITLSFAGHAAHYARAAGVPKLFVTFESHNGDFRDDATLAGATVADKADAFCARSSARPDTQSYKAVLVDGVSRAASPAINWVLKPDTTYFHASGMDRLFDTNASGTFTTNYGHTIVFSSSAVPSSWTGFDPSFATTQTCQGWTSTDQNLAATISDAGHTPPLYSVVVSACNAFNSPLICASQ